MQSWSCDPEYEADKFGCISCISDNYVFVYRDKSFRWRQLFYYHLVINKPYVNDFLNMKAEEVAFSELRTQKGISGINIQIGELYRSLSLTEKLPNLTYIRWTGDW